MSTDKFAMFQNRLQKVYKHFSKPARKQDIACFRFYDHDLPEFPFAKEEALAIIAPKVTF